METFSSGEANTSGTQQVILLGINDHKSGNRVVVNGYGFATASYSTALGGIEVECLTQ